MAGGDKKGGNHHKQNQSDASDCRAKTKQTHVHETRAVAAAIVKKLKCTSKKLLQIGHLTKIWRQ